jgi:hypothetical protein
MLLEWVRKTTKIMIQDMRSISRVEPGSFWMRLALANPCLVPGFSGELPTFRICHYRHSVCCCVSHCRSQSKTFYSPKTSHIRSTWPELLLILMDTQVSVSRHEMGHAELAGEVNTLKWTDGCHLRTRATRCLKFIFWIIYFTATLISIPFSWKIFVCNV